MIASKLAGPRGKVLAVEPQSRLQCILRANLDLNDCRNVHLVNAAISSRTEKLHLHLTSSLNNGGSSLYRPTKYALRKESVQSITLAELLSWNNIASCDLMKVDIEGGEYDVLMAAEPVLKSGIIRRISLEIHNSLLERRGLSGAVLHEWILSCGYEMSNELGNWVYIFKGVEAR